MDMRVNIAGVEWKNPVTVASGTFGSGEEFSEFVDLNKLGAVTTKGVANVPWPGNPTPRVAEVYGGMMNAIGLQNPGIDLFCKRDIPFLKQYDTKIIVNVCGHAPEEYLAVVERLADEPIVHVCSGFPKTARHICHFIGGNSARHTKYNTFSVKIFHCNSVLLPRSNFFPMIVLSIADRKTDYNQSCLPLTQKGFIIKGQKSSTFKIIARYFYDFSH